MNASKQSYLLPIIASIISAVLYTYIAHAIERTATIELLSSWGVLFVIFFYTVYSIKDKHTFKVLIISAITFRLLFLFSIPALSDDYFRFIWDGELLANGINPFLYTPSEIIENNIVDIPRLDTELYTGLNSPDYYSVYPPVMQFIFWLSAKLSINTLQAIVVMRSAIVLCEVGTIYLLVKMLGKFNLPRNNVLLYALNPLVIIELTGNLHFEAIMIFFLVLSLYLLTAKKILLSAIAFSLSVCSKLIPLILLPLLIRYLGFKKFVIYLLVVLVTTVILFIPFVNNELIINISKSIGLYFQTFEFNASIYYLLREVGYWVTGYNVIGVVGKVLPVVFLLFYGVYLLGQKSDSILSLFKSSIWILSVYYMLALIVHPWYISLLVVLSVFSNMKFPLVWSAMIGITYMTYQTTPYKENLYGVAIEYLVVLAAIIYDINQRKNTSVILQ